MEKREDHSPPRRCAVRFNQSKVSPCVRWRVPDREDFIVLQLIARSTNVRQVLALRRLNQRLTSRIDVSIDWHIGVYEPDRDQTSPHDTVDDCARLHQFNELRPDLSFKLFMGKSSAPRSQVFHWAFGVGRSAFGVFCWLLRYFSPKPFHQCHLSRS